MAGKITANELRAARFLCDELWNPIGLPMQLGSTDGPEHPLPADEYDGYLNKIMLELKAGASTEQLRDLLIQFEQHILGREGKADRRDKFLDELRNSITPV